MELKLIFALTLVVAFGNLVAGQDIPQCVLDAFPELNQTTAKIANNPYTGFNRADGLGCRICVGIIEEVEDILLDPDIEDVVNKYVYFRFLNVNDIVKHMFLRLHMPWKTCAFQ